MSHKTAIKIYEIASYVLILGATVVYFLLRNSGTMMGLSLTMILVALAIAMRWMMERHRFKACEEELDQMKDDLRRLTLLYAEEKKKNKQSNNQTI
jgi:heme A synthase